MKKKVIIFFVLISLVTGSSAQQTNPVQFNYAIKLAKDKKYELTITAKLDDGWHIYSQTQPKEAIAEPTKIVFTKSPLVVLGTKPLELGHKEKYEDKAAGIIQYQYARTVDFVQGFSLKAKVKLSITGSITYQTCTDERCLPARTVNFSVPVE